MIAINTSGHAQGLADTLIGNKTKLPINQVVATIPVGEQPWSIIVSPNSEYVYVVDAGSNTVSVIRASTRTVTSTIPVGFSPVSAGVTPDGKTIYVANSGDDTVSVIDSRKGIVIAKLDKVGYQPSSIAISPDGKWAYVANYGDGTVTIIDTKTNRIQRPKIHLKGEPFDLAFTPDRNEAYLACAGGNTGHMLMRKSPDSPGFVRIGGQKIALTTLTMAPDGKNLYGINSPSSTGEESVIKVDLADGKIVQNVMPPEDTINLVATAMTPDGKFVYVLAVSEVGPNCLVYLVDCATGQVVGQSLPVGYGTMSIAMAPDGRTAYSANVDDGTVSVISITYND